MIKSTLTIIAILIAIAGFSQDSIRTTRIDSLVSYYNHAGFREERDSIITNMPEMKFSSKTYITILIHEGAIKKYENRPTMTMQNKDSVQTRSGYNIFYFDKDKLIKVEEGTNDENGSASIDWYFDNDIAFFYKITPQKQIKAEKLEERGKLLVVMAKSILEKTAPYIQK